MSEKDERKFKNQGSLLKKLRDGLDLSQKNVADIMGHQTPQHVSNCERGLSPLGVKNWKKLCAEFGIDESKPKKAYLKDVEYVWDITK